MKKQYLSALVLALFTATASAQITTQDQANKQIEALAAANPTAATAAKAAVAAASDANGYNQAVKTFYQAIDGKLVYFTNTARGGKNYLTVSPTFAAAGDITTTPTAENVFELKYNAANDAFTLKHAVTGRALKNLPGFNNPVPTTAEEGSLYSFVASGQNNTFSLRNDATGGTHNFLHLAGDKTGAQYNVVRWSAGSGALNDASTWSIESANDRTENELEVAALQRFDSYDIQSNVGEKLGERQITQEAGDLMDKLEETSSSKLPVLHKLISAYADNNFFALNLPVARRDIGVGQVRGACGHVADGGLVSRVLEEEPRRPVRILEFGSQDVGCVGLVEEGLQVGGGVEVAEGLREAGAREGGERLGVCGGGAADHGCLSSVRYPS